MGTVFTTAAELHRADTRGYLRIQAVKKGRKLIKFDHHSVRALDSSLTKDTMKKAFYQPEVDYNKYFYKLLTIQN